MAQNKIKEKTLVIIKPDGVQKKLVGEILKRFEKEKFEITHLEIKKIKKPVARKFYSHLKTKIHPKIFNDIIEYMSSDKVVVCSIEGNNACCRIREICGPTNPKAAPKGTIRGDFGTDDLAVCAKKKKATKNIIHSSESAKHAKKEFKILHGK